MSAAASAPGRPRLVWLLVGLGLALLVGANWHLVHVAVGSQPDCVPHLRAGDPGAAGSGGRLSAAQSSCTPQ